MEFFNKMRTKVAHPLRGIVFALKKDLSFRLDIVVGIALIGFAYTAWPLSVTEVFFLFLSWVLLITAELQNTALETALNTLHPEMHEEIGNSKDLSAASVVMALLFIAAVVVHIFLVRFDLVLLYLT